jgi:hypothetical protein
VAVALAVSLAVAAACGGDDGNGGEGEPVVTDDPVATFAPLVSLHPKESWYPLSTRRFLDYATVSWAIEGCSDETIAIGAPRRRLGIDGMPPIVDPRRLGGGSNVYRHRTMKDARCRRRAPVEYRADQLTRPYDERIAERPKSLPIGHGFYLDLMSRRLRGDHELRRVRGQLVLRDAPVYAERNPVRVDGRPGLDVAYWLLYGAHEVPGEGNDIPRGHEGDWERVTVRLRRAGARRYVPVSVAYHAEDGDERLPWGDVERVGANGAPGDGADDTHPVVYAARGSHSPYPTPDARDVEIDQAGRTYRVVDRASPLCERCPQWHTWTNLRDLRAQPWYGFGGAWGYADYQIRVGAARGPSPYGG